MPPTRLRNHFKPVKNYDYDSPPVSSEEENYQWNELMERRSNKSLTLTVNPARFHLPFNSKAKATLVLENNNNSAVCFFVFTNSPETLEIEPRKGCIDSGEKVFMTVKRPKRAQITNQQENINIKIKYCTICNSTKKYFVDSDHYHAGHENKIFEKRSNEKYRNSIRKPDNQHLKHSQKWVLKPNDSRGLIIRNEIPFKPSPKGDFLRICPKLSQQHKRNFQINEVQSTGKENLQKGLYRKDTGVGNFPTDYDGNFSNCQRNELQSTDKENLQKGIYRKDKVVWNCSDDYDGNFAKCRCHNCSIQASERKFRNERSLGQCHNCCHCDHLYCYCSQNDANVRSEGTKLINTSTNHKKDHCDRQKCRHFNSGHEENRSKTYHEDPCCRHNTLYDSKDSVSLQGEYSPNLNFQFDRYADSKKRKHVKLDYQDEELDEGKIMKRNHHRNMLKNHNFYCECSMCSKRNRKMNMIDASQMKITQRVSVPSDSSEEGFGEINYSNRLYFYACIMLIILATIMAISFTVVYRKELNTPPTHRHTCLPIVRAIRYIIQ